MNRCSQCGETLADAPEGLCPSCLLKAGLASQTPADPNATADMPRAAAPDTRHGEALGSMIGHYKLLQRIGEGGFGSVYMAEQETPVRRWVALKIIKLGMDTRQVIGRFEAERQALAMMDHPNIAKVFDAGASESGRPFFVMELVRGVSITDYCDVNNVNMRQRLELFALVCKAVQHAHSKGIIHRDIKPSNVLVAMADGQPTPKIIDFGIAKATDQRLTEKTVFTEFRQMIGTPQYMSPEQAEMAGIDVDTRTDIYSLGVLLYELLVGTTPLQPRELRGRAYAEIQRIIREIDPPAPSVRLSASTETRATIAAHRRIGPAQLQRMLRGELDWIVMRAMEKDRTRRYETASALARDIERYLLDEPVEACPPTFRYRLAKFARRHKSALGMATAMALLLLLATGVSTWQAARATRANALAQVDRQRAEHAETAANKDRDRALREKARADEQAAIAAEINRFLQVDLLRQADPTARADTLLRLGTQPEPGADPTIKQLLDRAAGELTPGKIDSRFPDQPQVRSSILRTVGETYLGIGQYEPAIAFLTRVADANRQSLGDSDISTIESRDLLALAYKGAGKLAQAIELLDQLRGICQTHLGPEAPLTIIVTSNLALACLEGGQQPRAIDLFEEARAADLKTLGPDDLDTVAVSANLADAYQVAGRLKDAIALFEPARQAYERRLGPYHPATLNLLNNLSEVYRKERDFPKCIALLEQVRDGKIKALGPDHPQTLITLGNLASAYDESGDPQRGIAVMEQVRQAQERTLGLDNPDTLSTLNNLALAYSEVGKPEQSIAMLEKVRDGRAKLLGPGHPGTLTTINNLGGAYETIGKLDQALPCFQQAAAGVEKLHFHHEYAMRIFDNLANCQESLSQYADGEATRRKWLSAAVMLYGSDSAVCAYVRMMLGQNLLKQNRPDDAEALLRQSLESYNKHAPNDFRRFNAMSLLGRALVAQGQYPAAEPHLLQGYEGLREHGNAALRTEAVKALDSLAQLYQTRGKLDDAARWRNEVESAKNGN
jgi:serine/threonine protein kinase